MKIAFFAGHIYSEENGGVAVFQNYVIKELIQYDFKDEVIIYYRAKKNIYSNINKIKFVNLEFEKELKPKKILFFRLKKHVKDFDYILKRDGIDFVYFLVPEQERLKHSSYIMTVWDVEHRNHVYFPEVSQAGMYEAREQFYRDVLNKASFIVIGNKTGKQQISRYFNIDEHRIKINPMPTPDYVYSEQEDDSIIDKNDLRGKKYLFYPAQFWAHKNHIRLLKAMRILKEKGFKMVFTGSKQGNQDYINKKIKDYNLEDVVKCLGFVSQKEIIALYKNAYALAYASWLGPDNIPPLEAMALGCPVICSDFEGAKDQLGDCALYFDKADENSFIEALNKLEDKDLKQNLTEKGKKLAKERHTSNYVNNVMKIINEFYPIRECWNNND